MPQYNLDFGDGTSAVVSGPEGASKAQLLAIFEKQESTREEEPAFDFTAMDAARAEYLKALPTEAVEEAVIIDHIE